MKEGACKADIPTHTFEAREFVGAWVAGEVMKPHLLHWCRHQTD